MPALVAIEVTLPPCGQTTEQSCEESESSSVDMASLLNACNTALGQGSCVGASSEFGEHAVQVSVRSATSMAIEVRTRDGSPVMQRVLSFEQDDELAEKWRTVGFTTALMVGGRSRENETPQPPVPSFAGLVTARLVGASGFGALSPKAGGRLQMAGRAWQAPWLLGVSAEYTSSGWQTAGVNGDASWSEVGLEVIAIAQLTGDLELLGQVSALAQRVSIVGTKKDKVADDWLWQTGVRAALDLAWPLHARWFGVLGAHATWVAAPVEIRVEGKVAARIPTLGGGVNAGIQYRF